MSSLPEYKGFIAYDDAVEEANQELKRERMRTVVATSFEGTYFKNDGTLPQARGEQPDSQAMPADGALRGDVPLSSSSESEVQ